MRKFLISIISIFIGFSVFAAGENVTTSKSYVDSVVAEKQDTIDRTTGSPQVLTNTGTLGEYGTKDIYDSTGSYAEQSDALIDAVTMNTAVQNAIDSEFVCISWVNDDPNEDCLLLSILNQNLFNPTINPIQQGTIAAASGVDAGATINRIRTYGYIDVIPNTTYKIESNISRVFILFYDENGVFLRKHSSWQNVPYIFKTGDNVGKIRLVLSINDETQIIPSDLKYLTIEIYNKIYLPHIN